MRRPSRRHKRRQQSGADEDGPRGGVDERIVPVAFEEEGSGDGVGAPYASCWWTSGATWVPNSSMLVRSLSCGKVPALYFRLKRASPSALVTPTILVATVSGEPTKSAPFGPAASSNCSRVIGG